jgi:sugar diacid utilization regulator
MGVLCAWRRRRTPFTDADESLAEALADVGGAAIHNAECHGAARSRAARSEAARATLTERHLAAERDLHVYAELTRIAMEGTDVGAVVRRVGALTESPAVLVTDDGHVVASSGRSGADRLGARVVDCVRRVPAGGDGKSVAAPQDDGSWLLVASVRAAGITFGHLGLVLAGAPTSSDRLAAEQAAVVSALLLAREEAAVAAGRRVQSEFVWDLLDGRLPDSVEAGVRARHLGIGFTLPARVVAIEVTGPAEAATAGGWNAEQLERVRSTCSRLIGQGLSDAGVGGAVLARRADLFALVVPCARGETLSTTRRLTGALAAIRWPDGLSATAGVGGSVEHITRFPDGWREARLARSAAGPNGEPGVFEDLGVLQFLLAPASRDDLDRYARRLLGPLLDYDSGHGTELMRTLTVYLTAGCGTRRTAELLCIHHRTVAYRLQRIVDLTGLRLTDPEDRFRVQLACKILALSRGGVETTPYPE